MKTTKMVPDAEIYRHLQNATNANLGRRGFLKLSCGAGAGLVLGFSLLTPREAAAASARGDSVLNAFVRVAPDGTVIIYSKSPEIGQGLKTSFPAIIADEMDADWPAVRIEQGPINTKIYGIQNAGGSRSTYASWTQLRRAGATARAMLVSAAAQGWGVPAAECTTENGAVFHRASNHKASYGELSERAAALPLPDEKTVALKAPKDWKLIGKRISGVDNRKVVTGQPLFGIDTVLPNMLYASYTKCPAQGGTVASANFDQIKSLPGVNDAFVVTGNNDTEQVMQGVAIVATSTWAALSAKRQLKVVWDESKAAKDDSAALEAKALSLSKARGAEKVVATGDANTAFASAAKTLEATYYYPFLVHAALEPMNATAWFHDGIVEIWSPTQAPDRAYPMVATVTGLPEDKIVIHPTRVGGGFGRRGRNDYTCEVAAIAQKFNVPVKMQWTREDDFASDFYRPAGYMNFKASLDGGGKLTAWQNHFVTHSPDATAKALVIGTQMVADEFPAPIVANTDVSMTVLSWITRSGSWRAPRSNGMTFATQSFIHELAIAAGRDHRDFLLDVMGEPRWLKPGDDGAFNTERAIRVIREACARAGWGNAQPKGRALGLAFHAGNFGYVAQIADVSVDARKKVTVHKVWSICDVGPITNLSAAESQVEGSVIDGFGAMTKLQVDFANGRVKQSNFGEYELPRMANAFPVEVVFLESAFSPAGLGEPALPPLAGAICNAIFSATGDRIRSLPISKHGYTV